jgi:hypothetical protein
MRRYLETVCLVLAGALIAARLVWAVACSNTCCKQTNTQVVLDQNADVITCYQYVNQGTSCHDCCGKGSVGKGFCDIANCDPNQQCFGTTATIKYQIGQRGLAVCQIVSNFDEAVPGCVSVDDTQYDEMLCICGPPSLVLIPCR